MIEKINDFDYKIQIGRKIKVYHINLVKEYLERDATSDPEHDVFSKEEDEDEGTQKERVAVIIEEEDS